MKNSLSHHRQCSDTQWSGGNLRSPQSFQTAKLHPKPGKPYSAEVVSDRRKIPRPRLPAIAKLSHCLVNKSNAHRVGMAQAGSPERPRKSPKDQLQTSRHSCVCLESFGAHLEPRGMNNSRPVSSEVCNLQVLKKKTYCIN